MGAKTLSIVETLLSQSRSKFQISSIISVSLYAHDQENSCVHSDHSDHCGVFDVIKFCSDSVKAYLYNIPQSVTKYIEVGFQLIKSSNQ
jgi:hypothetical protein